MDDDTQMHNSKWLIPMNQSLHLRKDRFAQNILNYVISSALDVNNKSCLQQVYNFGKAPISLSKILDQFWLYLCKIPRTLMPYVYTTM